VIGATKTIPLQDRARIHGRRIAVVDSQGSFSYDQLLDASTRVASALLACRANLEEERVAFLVTPGFPWVAVQWGIWRAGGIAVPLPLDSAKPEL
jgi:malonyl-CoA/methylmalonyl-CoA synthetase